MSIGITKHEAEPKETCSRFTVVFFDDQITTTVTSFAADVENWISNIHQINICRMEKLIVGLDVEWRPNFLKNVINPVAVLQLCVGHHCLVYQILHAECIPKPLIDFLADPRFTFVGIEIEKDATKLLKDYSIAITRSVDLRTLAAEKLQRIELRKAGIKRMTLEILGREMNKPKQVTLSRWDCIRLREEQIQYASIDAFLSFEIGRVLMNC